MASWFYFFTWSTTGLFTLANIMLNYIEVEVWYNFPEIGGK